MAKENSNNELKLLNKWKAILAITLSAMTITSVSLNFYFDAKIQKATKDYITVAEAEAKIEKAVEKETDKITSVFEVEIKNLTKTMDNIMLTINKIIETINEILRDM